jgi:arylsulfatase
MPTILDYTGCDYPAKMEERDISPGVGISLLPAFKGEEMQGRDTLFWEHQFNRAVRVGDWKLVSAYKILDKKGRNDKWELYNLADDPTEQKDVSAEYPEKVKQLEQLYRNWAKRNKVLTHNEMKNLKLKKQGN